MEFSLNSNSLQKRLASGKGLEPEEIAALAAEAGFQYMEWGLPKEDVAAAAARMRKAAEANGLKVLSYINGPSILFPERVLEVGKIAADNGGTRLRIAHPWFAWDLNESRHQPDDFTKLVEMSRAGLAKLNQLAGDLPVQFVFETHGSSVFASPWAAYSLMAEYPASRYGMIYDPTNTWLEGFVRPRGAVELLGDKLSYIHAKGLKIVFEGGERKTTRCGLAEGAANWPEIFFALKLHNRKPVFSFEEMASPAETVLDELKAGRDYLLKTEAEAPSTLIEPYLDFNYK